MQIREKNKIIPNRNIGRYNLSIEEKQMMQRLVYEHPTPCQYAMSYQQQTSSMALYDGQDIICWLKLASESSIMNL